MRTKKTYILEKVVSRDFKNILFTWNVEQKTLYREFNKDFFLSRHCFINDIYLGEKEER